MRKTQVINFSRGKEVLSQQSIGNSEPKIPEKRQDQEELIIEQKIMGIPQMLLNEKKRQLIFSKMLLFIMTTLKN